MRTRRATRSHFDELKFEDGYVPVKVALHIEDGEAISIGRGCRTGLGFKNVVDVKKATVWKLYLKGREAKTGQGDCGKAAHQSAQG